MFKGGLRLQRYVSQGVKPLSVTVRYEGVWGGQNRKFLRYIFFERPLSKVSTKVCVGLPQDDVGSYNFPNVHINCV